MSFCRVRDIGAAATLRHVQAAANALDNAGIEFYAAENSWIEAEPNSYQFDVGVQSVDTKRQLVSLTSAERISPSGALTTVPIQSIKRRRARLTMSPPIGNMRFTGETGVVSKLTLAAGVDLFAGDTIIRSGAVMLLAADAMSQSGDIQLIAPGFLRSCAISVARRIMSLEADESLDDKPNSDLLDGWRDELAKYR